MRPIRLLLAAKTSVLRAIPLMRDARVPFAMKASTVALGALIVSPVDVFSDIPVLGVLDDAALLSLLCYLFVRFAARHVEPKLVGSHVVAQR